MIELYRHFAADGTLLYVGISNSAVNRLRGHAHALWRKDLSTLTVERYPDRVSAEKAERAAIISEKPLYNVQHTNQAGAPELPKGVDGLHAAIREAGSQTKLAKLIGVRQSHISSWLHRNKRVPSGRVCAIERATGVPRHDLRPDLYPLDAA